MLAKEYMIYDSKKKKKEKKSQRRDIKNEIVVPLIVETKLKFFGKRGEIDKPTINWPRKIYDTKGRRNSNENPGREGRRV